MSFILRLVYFTKGTVNTSSGAIVIAKLAFYIEGRYLVHDELQFVENLKKDIDYFVEISKSKSVLVFPPILSKYRFLAHKAVDEYFFPQLCSFSIGQESRRQIIVGSTIDITRCCLPYRCVHEKLFRLSKVLEKRVDCICPARLKSLSFSFPKDFTMPSTSCDPSPKYGAKDHDNTLFKPSERRRNENRPGIRDRQKRPDKQIYVPRALREMPKSIPVENKIVTEDETNSIHENNQAILLKHVVCSKNDQEKQFEAVNSESIIKKKSQVTSEDETNSIQENNQAISFKNIVCSESDQEKPFEEVNSESNVKMEKQLLSEDEKNCIKKNNQAIVCSESDQEKHFEAVNSESNVKMEKQVLSEDETNSIQENNQAIVCSESDQEKHFKAVNSENSIKKENQVQSEDETNSIKNNQAMSLKHVVCSENDQKKNFEAINSESNIKKESQLPIEEVSNGLRNLEPEVAVSSISSSSLSDKICEESLIAGSSHTFEINILHNQISEKIAVFPQKVTDVDHFLSINADLSLSLKDSETQNPDNSCILNNIHKNTESLLENSSREYSYQDSGIQTTANISLSDNISKTSDINLLENSSGECKNEVISSNKSDQYPCLENEDSWETKFDDDGECLNPDFVKELKNVTGQMKVLVAKQNYRDFQPITENFNGGCDTIVELYDFPREFSTQDLVSAFSQFQQSSYTITWVDDCHALAVFSSPAIANQALILNHPFVKVRPIAEGIKESKEKARWCARNSEPVKPRPTTSAVLARRLVSGALGLKVRATKEQRDQERSILNDAKEKRRLKAKQKQAIWDGKVL